MSVYKAINAVQTDLAKAGISKDSENTFDRYKFRGIDAVYNALSPLLAKHGLCILPRVLSRTVAEHASQKGGVLFYVTVEVEFDFVCAEDGSKHTVKTFGEAMDRGDKATNKAMSAAYKYAAFQSFAIPTEGDNDADASTHEVKAKPKAAPVIPATPDIKVDLERSSILFDTVESIKERFDADDLVASFELYDGIHDQEEKIFIWKQLPSHIRSAIKAYGQKLKENA
jgi:hypothetical protein